MELSVPSIVLLLLVLGSVVSSSKLGRSAYEYHPHLGAAGVVANAYLPQAEVEGEGEDFFPQAGIVGTTASLLFSKALHCLTDKSIYTACEETHRLSESGELHVLPDDTDKYCNGPCLAETHHVLDCMKGIFNGFIFLNTATLNDVRDTIDAGCGYGPHRGNFNVLEHVNKHGDEPAESGNNVNVAPGAAFSTLLVLIVGLRLLF